MRVGAYFIWNIMEQFQTISKIFSNYLSDRHLPFPSHYDIPAGLPLITDHHNFWPDHHNFWPDHHNFLSVHHKKTCEQSAAICLIPPTSQDSVFGVNRIATLSSSLQSWFAISHQQLFVKLLNVEHLHNVYSKFEMTHLASPAYHHHRLHIIIITCISSSSSSPRHHHPLHTPMYLMISDSSTF